MFEMDKCREEFEKIEWVKDRLKYVWWSQNNEYCDTGKHPRANASFLNGALYLFREQQAKVEELQKRVDVLTQTMGELLEEMKYPTATFEEVIVCGVKMLEQALKGGRMKAIKIPCEHDLLSKDDDIWANAVMRCKGGSPYCGADGYCHAGGTCFADQELTREQAILEVDRLAQELHNAKIENDKLRNAASQLVSQLELAKEQNLKNGNDQRVFALKFCIHEIKKAMG